MKTTFFIILALAISAQAALDDGAYVLISHANAEVLQIKNNATTDGAQLETGKLVGGMNQLWAIATSKGLSGIGSGNNGENAKFINVPNDSKGDVDLQVATIQVGMNYFWNITEQPNTGLVTIQSKSSGKFLTSRPAGSNKNIYQSNRDNQRHQLWRPFRLDRPEPLPLVNGGKYYFLAGAGNNYVWDIFGARKDDGAPLTTYPLHGGSNQIFQVKVVAGNWFNIIVVGSQKAIAAKIEKNNVGSAVIQAKLRNGDEYLWSFSKGPAGTWVITNKLTGFNLQGKDGAKVSQDVTIENKDLTSGKQNWWAVRV